MQVHVMIKAIRHSLGEEYKVKNFKGHVTLYKDLSDNCQIKISNFNKFKGTVNIVLSDKGNKDCDIINYIKLNVPLKDIEQNIDELIKIST